MTNSYDEATLDLLRLTIPTYGVIVPIILRSGTNEVIDGRHRMKIREELLNEGIKITLPVHHVDTDNPAEIDQIVNSVRRPWQDAAQRQELVKKLRERGHSQQRIADAVGTHKKTVQNDLKAQAATGEKAPVAASTPEATTGKDGKTRKPPATPEEIAQAWAMRDSGMSTTAIAKDLGRGERTVRDWLVKERPEAAQQTQPPSSAPETPALTPDPLIETTENRMFEPESLTTTSELSDEVKALVKRERQSMAERVSHVRHLQGFNQASTKHWKHLQRKFKSQGRSVIAHNMRIAAKSLQEDKALEQWAESLGISTDSSYEDCLWATVDLARSLDKSIRLSLYLAGFIDGPGVMDRPTGT